MAIQVKYYETPKDQINVKSDLNIEKWLYRSNIMKLPRSRKM
jgi:hypothetical protein